MTDEEFLAALEDGSLPAASFDHVHHVRAAWLYLRRLGFTDGMAAFRHTLRAFATRHGAADKYNETITVAWLVLIHERLAVGPTETWPDFAARHCELLDRRLLYRYYRPETLRSDRARRVFVLGEPAAQPHT